MKFIRTSRTPSGQYFATARGTVFYRRDGESTWFQVQKDGVLRLCTEEECAQCAAAFITRDWEAPEHLEVMNRLLEVKP